MQEALAQRSLDLGRCLCTSEARKEGDWVSSGSAAHFFWVSLMPLRAAPGEPQFVEKLFVGYINFLTVSILRLRVCSVEVIWTPIWLRWQPKMPAMSQKSSERVASSGASDSVDASSRRWLRHTPLWGGKGLACSPAGGLVSPCFWSSQSWLFLSNSLIFLPQ